MDYKIVEEYAEIKSRFTKAMADKWAEAGTAPVSPETGEPATVGDVMAISQGVKLSAITDDGEVIASVTCKNHPMTVSNFTQGLRRRTEAELRKRRLLERIEKQNFALPDLSPSYTGPIIAAYIEYTDDPPPVPQGWSRWESGRFFGDREQIGETSVWEACGCESSGLTVSYSDAAIFDYLEPEETLPGAQARLRKLMQSVYGWTGPGPVMIVRAPAETPIPEKYTELVPDNKFLDTAFDVDIFNEPLEHCAGDYPSVCAKNLMNDTRTTYIWVRPCTPEGKTWLCGCGIGSHTYQAPGTYPDQSSAEKFSRLWRDADVAERVVEAREDLIGQSIIINDEPELIVADATGSLWDYLRKGDE